MHAKAPAVAGLGDQPVDPWVLLTGGSVAIVAGLCADLLRLGVHEVKRVMAASSRRRHGTPGDWHRPCTCNR